jgi:hypothetical protein
VLVAQHGARDAQDGTLVLRDERVEASRGSVHRRRAHSTTLTARSTTSRSCSAPPSSFHTARPSTSASKLPSTTRPGSSSRRELLVAEVGGLVERGEVPLQALEHGVAHPLGQARVGERLRELAAHGLARDPIEVELSRHLLALPVGIAHQEVQSAQPRFADPSPTAATTRSSAPSKDSTSRTASPRV